MRAAIDERVTCTGAYFTWNEARDPALVGGLFEAVQVEWAGNYAGAGRTRDGHVYWFEQSQPAYRIEGVDSAVDVAAGYFHACALTATGEVVCWGRINDQGQLGDGTDEPHDDPMPVLGLK